jgi:LysR family transcriptional regulator, cell division regulator
LIRAFLKNEYTMELLDLKTFMAVAHSQGITRASRALNTVASNVTTRIKGLEENIGVPLFARHSRGMVLTEAGQRLLPYAHQLLALSAEALASTRDDGVARGRLNIGSMETTAAVRLPALLARYHRACPEVKIMLQTGPTADLIDRVVARDIDVALVSGPVEHSALHTQAVFVEQLVLVTPRAVRTNTDLLYWAETGLTALMFRLGCSYRQRLEQVLADMGQRTYSRLEMGTLDGILGCVAAGLGVTVLPKLVVEKSALAGQLSCHKLPDTIGKASTLLVYRSDSRCGAALEAFRACFLRTHNASPAD